GVYLAYYLIKISFGFATLIIPILGTLWGWLLLTRKKLGRMILGTGYGLLSVVLISITLGFIQMVAFSEEVPSIFMTSGVMGGLIISLLIDFLGRSGSSIFIITIWLVVIRGYFSWSYFELYKKLIGDRITSRKAVYKKKKIKHRAEKVKEKHTQELLSKLEKRKSDEQRALKEDILKEKLGKSESDQELNGQGQSADQVGIGATTTPELKPEIRSGDEPIEVGEMVTEEEVDLDKIKERQTPKRKYQLPTADLLNLPDVIEDNLTKEELIERANFLTQSLATFGVEGSVVNVSPGPVITLFEVEPAEGVRVNKFVQLSDDIARVMEASRVRVIAPIPGKSSVGIEIPNRNPATVYFKAAINSEKFANSESLLTLAIGKTTNGEIATLDLATMPHLLIAGTTGSGKSVCLNTIICSILYRATPEEVKFIIIDPKKVEMSLLRSLEDYHLMGINDINEPIVTTSENAILALRSLEKEMDRRYNVLADAVVRNIDEYNKKMRSEEKPIMPYIILIIDELADLMMMSAKDVETPIARLAQLARAVGLHLVIATQRPSVDVITGVIKANFPARIGFQVATKIDSRTILDGMGAEKLIGRGDMLYLGPGSSEPVRMHNAYVSLEEIEAVMKHIRSQPKPAELKLESVREMTMAEFKIDTGSTDDLFREAVQLVVTHQQGSISLLQRRLSVGYARAARLIDQMEQSGIVGPFTGSKAREVLVDESYLESPPLSDD
ncbi:MAG: DNA translocase FtsK 4TM domain-containing protein, partial [Candidatus Neomarinimicrobiota bacterium]